MPVVDPFADEIPEGMGLRTELSLRGIRYAAEHGYRHERTDGSIPSILFGCDESGHHGNFHPASYQRIVQTPSWARRLKKAHNGAKRAWVRADWHWKELDCAHSSDALLMNIFCHPETVARAGWTLGVLGAATPEFGFKPRTPLSRGTFDNTEIDMKLEDLLVEAKLTESDFQSARPELVTRYRGIEEVFDCSELPQREGRYCRYQLIRGVMAAHHLAQSFCVFCDARRPDLVEDWYRVIRAVRLPELRYRLKLLTWQELSSVLSEDMQIFLAARYGIRPKP